MFRKKKGKNIIFKFVRFQYPILL